MELPSFTHLTKSHRLLWLNHVAYIRRQLSPLIQSSVCALQQLESLLSGSKLRPHHTSCKFPHQLLRISITWLILSFGFLCFFFPLFFFLPIRLFIFLPFLLFFLPVVPLFFLPASIFSHNPSLGPFSFSLFTPVFSPLSSVHRVPPPGSSSPHFPFFPRLLIHLFPLQAFRARCSSIADESTQKFSDCSFFFVVVISSHYRRNKSRAERGFVVASGLFDRGVTRGRLTAPPEAKLICSSLPRRRHTLETGISTRISSLWCRRLWQQQNTC